MAFHTLCLGRRACGHVTAPRVGCGDSHRRAIRVDQALRSQRARGQEVQAMRQEVLIAVAVLFWAGLISAFVIDSLVRSV